MESTIRLFKALPISAIKKKNASKALTEKTVKMGFLFAPEVIANYSESKLFSMADVVGKEIGLTGEQANSSFHKSWKKVKEADITQLVMEQIVHYITTYGFEELGIYNENSVYLPTEKLEVPNIKVKSFDFIVIRGYTKKQIKDKTMNLLGAGIAFSDSTMNDLIDVGNWVGLTDKDFELIKNKEIRIAFFDHFGLFPENPIEFLRYAIYKATGSTLLIKNEKVINDIKQSTTKGLAPLFKRYERKHGLGKLAQIFHRFKPLFLAFKAHEAGPIINRIRKLAVVHHKSMPTDYLNEVTRLIANGSLDNNKLKSELSKANVFRKVRLAYALKFRTQKVDSILYKIRNGKGYATDFSFPYKTSAKGALELVLNSIVEDVGKNVKGKKIYIPDTIHYALPATEKQFTGYLPSGTLVEIPKDMVFGVHWSDKGNNRIDLDLSLHDLQGNKFGWDGYYRNKERNILFSGDMTYAPQPNGASELFYVKRQNAGEYLLHLNYFNFRENEEVPFYTFVAHEQVSRMKKNYLVNPNNIICKAKSSILVMQKTLGLLSTTTKTSRFYFCEIGLGMSITSGGMKYTENALKYMVAFYKNMIGLKEILEKAGAKIVDNKEKCDIDLSPENLEKDSILNLLK